MKSRTRTLFYINLILAVIIIGWFVLNSSYLIEPREVSPDEINVLRSRPIVRLPYLNEAGELLHLHLKNADYLLNDSLQVPSFKNTYWPKNPDWDEDPFDQRSWNFMIQGWYPVSVLATVIQGVHFPFCNPLDIFAP